MKWSDQQGNSMLATHVVGWGLSSKYVLLGIVKHVQICKEKLDFPTPTPWGEANFQNVFFFLLGTERHFHICTENVMFTNPQAHRAGDGDRDQIQKKIGIA